MLSKIKNRIASKSSTPTTSAPASTPNQPTTSAAAAPEQPSTITAAAPEQTSPLTAAAAPEQTEAQTKTAAATTTGAMSKIAIVYYSSYGHVRVLSEAVAEGIRSTGATVELLRVKETLPAEVQSKMYIDHAKDDQYPEVEVNKLPDYDGIIFACPTRYGRVAAQMSQMFDQTGGLWAGGKLVGKFAATITSTSSAHGGQETTHLTTYPFFAHHGMTIVTLGYSHPAISNGSVVQGGSAYGASAIAPADPKQARDVNEEEKAIAEHQGKHFAGIVNAYVKGKAASA